MSNRYDTVIPQGATWTRSFQWLTGSPAAAVNLAGATARMTLRAFGQTAVELTTANGRIAIDGPTGTTTCTLDATTTAALAITSYAYDLEVVIGSTVKRLAEGYLTVSPNITT